MPITSIGSAAEVDAVQALVDALTTAAATYAPKVSPALTGSPTINGVAAATTIDAIAMSIALGG